MKKQVIPAFTLIECLIGLMILSSLLLTFNLLIQQTIQVSEFLQRKEALCQMMLVKRNLRIIGDQVDQFLLIFFS
ncbi:prepilin-type N-terminal cleavage/methylation domain-containing protein [Enterococcus faecium]